MTSWRCHQENPIVHSWSIFLQKERRELYNYNTYIHLIQKLFLWHSLVTRQQSLQNSFDQGICEQPPLFDPETQRKGASKDFGHRLISPRHMLEVHGGHCCSVSCSVFDLGSVAGSHLSGSQEPHSLAYSFPPTCLHAATSLFPNADISHSILS